MNKKNYLAPSMETIVFREDIVRTSIPDEIDGVKHFNKDWLSEE